MSATDRARFFLAEPGLERLATLDPARDWRELVTGDRAWTLQTYLRLAAAGLAVELVNRVGDEARDRLVVFHAKQSRALTAMGGASRAVLVGIRADNRQPLAAEFEILQNGAFADRRSRFAVPFWPQPGLVPRDAARGDRLERVAFKGFVANLDPELASPGFRAELERRGLVFDCDAIAFSGASTATDVARWADYREVDLVLALRRRSSKTDRSKPANKLVNAWLAGVPALLGPEFGFRELRRSELDYLEVEDATSALAAIDRLRASPGLYRAMVERGRARSGEFSVEAIVERWRELLFDVIPRFAASPRRRALRRLPLGARRVGRLVGRLATLRPAR